MNNEVIRVSYNHMYDFYFRTRNVRLAHVVYRVEFMDWVKAGVAFNARGLEVSTRKIAYFGDLYTKLQTVDNYESIVKELRVAVTRYYEDLYLLYQDHLASVKRAIGQRGKASKPLYTNLVILPSFSGCNKLYKLIPSVSIDLADYVPKNKQIMDSERVHLDLDEESGLYKCMSMYYDNSIKSDGNVVLLEVNECPQKIWKEQALSYVPEWDT